MTCRELIEQLQQMPPEALVYHAWDGSLRTEINVVWLARCGVVGTADYDMRIYYTDHRPADAPTEEAESQWRTPLESLPPDAPPP